MRTAFSPFGAIMKIDMPHDAQSGHHKGFAFIEFEEEDAATLALATMDAFPLAGRRIKVSRPQSLGISIGGGGGGGVPPPAPPSKAESVAAAAAVAAAAVAAASRSGPPGSPGPELAAASPGASAALAAPRTPVPSPPVSPLSPQAQAARQPAQRAPNNFVLLADFHPRLTAADVTSIATVFGEVRSCQVRVKLVGIKSSAFRRSMPRGLRLRDRAHFSALRTCCSAHERATLLWVRCAALLPHIV